MSLEVPRTLSPSKVATFTDCALAFRYSAIDRLPQETTVAAARGTLVHGALELLMGRPAADRTVPEALACLAEAYDTFGRRPEWLQLGFSTGEAATFLAEADELVQRYFLLEDPRQVLPIGLELPLEAEIDGVLLRGIIDRLELDAGGELVVSDYKTGRAPGIGFERPRLSGVELYSLLCERNFGRRPARVQLLHLHEPTAIVSTPNDRSTRAVERRLGAVWSAIEQACAHEDFAPRVSPACGWCSYKAYCPAWGGDPTLALVSGEAGAAPPSPLDLLAPLPPAPVEVRAATTAAPAPPPPDPAPPLDIGTATDAPGPTDPAVETAASAANA